MIVIVVVGFFPPSFCGWEVPFRVGCSLDKSFGANLNLLFHTAHCRATVEYINIYGRFSVKSRQKHYS